MKTISQLVKEIKEREQKELIAKVKECYSNEYVEHHTASRYGDLHYEYNFGRTSPCIAAYLCDDPCDVVVVNVDVCPKSNLVKLEVYEKGDELETTYWITADDVFAGHLEYVTSEIC